MTDSTDGATEALALLEVPKALISASKTLDGATGLFRSADRPLIKARNDLEAINGWLREFSESPHTERAYRREAERLLMWSLLVAGKPLSSLDRDDFDIFFGFLANPPANWVMAKQYPRRHPEWRPCRGPQTPSGAKQTKIILDAMFCYLVDARYLIANPLALMRRKTRGVKRSTISLASKAQRHALSENSIHAIRSYLSAREMDANVPRNVSLRDRVIFEVLLITGARRSDLSASSHWRLHSARGRWWLSGIGKGEKEASLAIPGNVMEWIAQYRQEDGLPPYPPVDGDDVPVIRGIRRRSTGKAAGVANPQSNEMLKGVEADRIYALIKQIFVGAHDYAVHAGAAPASVSELISATTHYLRHTALTNAWNETHDLAFVKNLGRHENVNTSMGYVTGDEDAHHDKVSKLSTAS